MEFTERTELERGFSAIFSDRVGPALQKIEKDRVARLGTARRWMVICILSGLVLAGAIYAIAPSTGGIVVAVVAVIVGIIAGLVVRGAQAKAWSGAVEDAVMPAICAHVGDLHFDSKAQSGFPVQAMRELGMLGSYDRVSLRDELRGSYRDTEYRMVEATLSKQTRDSDNKTKTSTVFRGLLFHIAVPMTAPGRILIARDHGALMNSLGAFFSGKSRRGMPRVETEHDRFEKAFEVHADDPDGARAFMPPAFLDALLDIGEGEGGKRGAKAMVAGFQGQAFYLALMRSDGFMEMGALNRSVAQMEEDLHAIFADIELARRIVDRLHGDVSRAA